jgi:hypothetical protein
MSSKWYESQERRKAPLSQSTRRYFLYQLDATFSIKGRWRSCVGTLTTMRARVTRKLLSLSSQGYFLNQASARSAGPLPRELWRTTTTTRSR